AAVLHALDKIETFRNFDKEKVQTIYGATPKSEPVTSSLADLRYVVEKKVKKQELKKEIVKYIDRTEKDYHFINETLLKSAGAGLSLSIVIHEIEKIIKELLEVLKKSKATERSLHLAKHLSQLVEGYSFILRGSGVKTEKLVDLVDQALFNIEFRLSAHKIDVITDYNKPLTSSKIKCARRFVINSVLNILDNSIWWLNYYGIREKKVYITISEEMKGYTSIVIADNGKGFSLPTEEVVKPFVSGKPSDMGMGIGLHLVNESMIAQKGLLVFPDWGDFSVPKEFKDGAIIALCFKNKE
ncbi:HAMP domain-containing histidine kinase, partial [bacterium]|nr:HAMP domain-containing histidine kinase [bacterium]